jgi:rare lipoprotein A
MLKEICNSGPTLAGVLAALLMTAALAGGGTVVSPAEAAASKGTPEFDPATASDPSLRAEESKTPSRPQRLSAAVKPVLDRSGRKRIGKASFYAKMFDGRKMADGTPMQPTGDNAASRTLPLGTTAKVTNLETGKTAIVTIRDRGPYVAGRIVDLSPASAHEIGLDQRKGVTRVEVAPIAVPMPDGQIKLGEGILEASNNRLDANIRTP